MSRLRHLATLLRLGPVNLARVGAYRAGLRTGLHPVQRVRRTLGGDAFFAAPAAGVDLPAPQAWRTASLGFGWLTAPLGDSPPDWHASLLDGRRAGGADRPWWTIGDFDLPVGDIKTVWEASRLDWAVAFAQQAAAGDPSAVPRLNAWLADWCRANPAFLGVNWKCGQEASLRVLHLALAARLLGQDARPTADLVRLVEAHLARMRPTVAYAQGQDNNHGTSEAAALFIGGSLCAAGGLAAGEGLGRLGRRLLQERVARLVAPDGSFSQHSVNYHRLMLDTLSLAELWRRWHGLPAFEGVFMNRAAAAADWLHHLVEVGTGDAPNLGANDGANLLPLTDAPYRDHRPSVQLAMALFRGRAAYAEPGPHDDYLAWLGVARPANVADAPRSRSFSDGGYAVLRRDGWMALLRVPHFRFRPHHCDALHLDLWRGGVNLLRDGGSYSYNAEAPWQDLFPGTSAHNTLSFDDHEQMPRLGRFLWGSWPEADGVRFEDSAGGRAAMTAAYTDWCGCRHERSVTVDGMRVTVSDRVAGFRARTVLRWRLCPGAWSLDGQVLRGEGVQLAATADAPIVRMALVEGVESRRYLEKSALPVLEVEVGGPCTVTTVITAALPR
ncbi:MAG TPA: heparinase II/III-family protein [Candidatus Krumholzibacteria bacterium]|nr:heparinase II/III-family protein [Candidatus Krumholzibacteria bacterium]